MFSKGDYMNFISGLLGNPLFLAPALAWFLAQLIKTILYLIINKDLRLERMFGSGGMPSSHSATVTALVVVTAFKYGVSGFEFPMALFFAIVVMHDAMGVRRETGKQAVVIKSLAEELQRINGGDFSSMDALKEFVGHTPLQVAAGAFLGFLVGILISL